MAVELLCQPADVISARSAFGVLSAAEQTTLCTVASQRVLKHCRRPGFVSAVQNEYHSGKNSASLWLRMRPVITIMSVTINTELVDNTDGQAYTFVPGTGQLVRGPGFGSPRFQSWWPVGTGNILVEYWGGYDQNVGNPPEVTLATVFEVLYLWERGKVSGIYLSESLGDYSYTLAATSTTWGLCDNAIDLLVDYVQDDAFAFA